MESFSPNIIIFNIRFEFPLVSFKFWLFPLISSSFKEFNFGIYFCPIINFEYVRTQIIPKPLKHIYNVFKEYIISTTFAKLTCETVSFETLNSIANSRSNDECVRRLKMSYGKGILWHSHASFDQRNVPNNWMSGCLVYLAPKTLENNSNQI